MAIIFDELQVELPIAIDWEPVAIQTEQLFDIGSLWSNSWDIGAASTSGLTDEISDYLGGPCAETAWLDHVATEHRRALRKKAHGIVAELPGPGQILLRSPVTLQSPFGMSEPDAASSNVAAIILHSLDNFVRLLFADDAGQSPDASWPRCAIVSSSSQTLRFADRDPVCRPDTPVETELLVWVDKNEWTVVRQVGFGSATFITSRTRASSDRSSLARAVQVVTELYVGDSFITEIPRGAALFDSAANQPTFASESEHQFK